MSVPAVGICPCKKKMKKIEEKREKFHLRNVFENILFENNSFFAC